MDPYFIWQLLYVTYYWYCSAHRQLAEWIMLNMIHKSAGSWIINNDLVVIFITWLISQPWKQGASCRSGLDWSMKGFNRAHFVLLSLLQLNVLSQRQRPKRTLSCFGCFRWRGNYMDSTFHCRRIYLHCNSICNSWALRRYKILAVC